MPTRRRWMTATFWLDTLERVVRTFLATLGSILAATTEWPSDWSTSQWQVLVYATLGTLIFCLLAGLTGEPGTATFMNPAPPDTLEQPPVKDRGMTAVEIVLIVAIVLAVLYILSRI